MTKTEVIQFDFLNKKINFTYCYLDIYLLSALLILWSMTLFNDKEVLKDLLIEISHSKTINSTDLTQKEEIVKKLVKEFENEAYFRGINIDASSITFNIKSDLDHHFKRTSENTANFTVLGVCHSLGHINYKDDLFNEEYKFQLRAVVFHELGHCLWDLDHKGTSSMDIMSKNAYDWDKAFLKANGRNLWNYQVDNFFNEIKRNKQAEGMVFRFNQQMAKLQYQTYWKIKSYKF